jgi:predicted RNase H-like nuclease (RuvC/YqgF family)
VSESEGQAPEPPEELQALSRLESAVGKLLRERSRLLKRVEEAEGRARELSDILDRVKEERGRGSDPIEREKRMEALDAENRELRARIREGREGVERLLSRIRFLTER